MTTPSLHDRPPSDPTRRSMSASTIRPVRHSIPLPLSIVARPHEAGLIRSWRADSALPLSGSVPELPHVAKVVLHRWLKILAGCGGVAFAGKSGGTSSPHAKLIGELGSVTTAIRIGNPAALEVLANNSDRCTFRLLQQYPPERRTLDGHSRRSVLCRFCCRNQDADGARRLVPFLKPLIVTRGIVRATYARLY